MRAWIALLPFVMACGGGRTPTSPSPAPSPTPAPITLTATITDTVSGAVLGQFVQSVNGLPTQITVSRAGYVTRQTWAHSAEPRVDLFPEAGFDLTFYRQFARGSLDGSVQPLRVLRQAPSIYLQRAGLSDANVAALEAAARAVVPALTGGQFQVVGWETGTESRAMRLGWITVDLVNDSSSCGRAEVGLSAGHVWLNQATRCHSGEHAVHPGLFSHEIGHALGFFHVDRNGALMKDGYLASTPTTQERHHAALAYARQPGNQDVDSDPATPASFQTMTVVD